MIMCTVVQSDLKDCYTYTLNNKMNIGEEIGWEVSLCTFAEHGCRKNALMSVVCIHVSR